MTLEQFLGFLALLIKAGVIWYVGWTIVALILGLLFWFVIGPKQDRAFKERSRARRAEMERNKWR